MTLVDAGPLIALIDAGEPDHLRCREVLDTASLPLVTSWPAFTEAIYLLGRNAGWAGQESLWRMVERDVLRIESLDAKSIGRSAELMHEYRDHPMDLADATLVALAEAGGYREIFTLDAHFHSYRLAGGASLRVVP